MIRALSLAAALSVMACLSGCASLRIQMDVLNPAVAEQIKAGTDVEVRVVEIQSGESSVTQSDLAAAKRAAWKVISDEVARLEAEAARTTGSVQLAYQSSAQSIADKDEFNDDWARAAAIAEPKLKANETLIRSLDVSNLNRSDAARYLSERAALLRTLVVDFGKDELQEVDSGLRLGDAKAEAMVERAVKSILPGEGLGQTRYAYAVKAAPATAWKTTYDKAEASADLGNTDIAIKLDSSGVFTIKGMQFDPSTIATVASKVSTQALLLATQIAGVPLSGGPDNGGALLDATNAQAAGDTTMLIRAAQAEAHEDALYHVADIIFAEEGRITDASNNAQAIQAAFAIIETYLDGYRPLLSPPAQSDTMAGTTQQTDPAPAAPPTPGGGNEPVLAGGTP